MKYLKEIGLQTRQMTSRINIEGEILGGPKIPKVGHVTPT